MKRDDKQIEDRIDNLLEGTKHSTDAEIERMILRLRRKHPRHVRDALKRKREIQRDTNEH